MAAPFITVARTTPAATHSSRLLAINNQIKQLREGIDSLVAESFQMFDGDGSDVSHFVLVAEKYGVDSTTKAKAVFDLLNGTKAALDGTGQNANAVALATQIG